MTWTWSWSAEKVGGWCPTLTISTYIRSTPAPARPSVLIAADRVAFRDRDEVVRTLSTVTPLTNGPGEVTTMRVAVWSTWTAPLRR